ncbi:hypothetical protein Efla_005234 [Eimeria flavescens]
MAASFSVPSALLGAEEECSSVHTDDPMGHAEATPSSSASGFSMACPPRLSEGSTGSSPCFVPDGMCITGLKQASNDSAEPLPDTPRTQDPESPTGWDHSLPSPPSSESVEYVSNSADASATGTDAHGMGDASAHLNEKPWGRSLGTATREAAKSTVAAAAATVSAATDRLMMMHLFVSRLLRGGSSRLRDREDKETTEHDSKKGAAKTAGVSMAFHERGHESELLQYHFMILILAVTVAFGTQNALAPNLTRIAETFHFSETERDLRIGGTLAFLFYAPGCVGAIAVGLCAGVLNRNRLVSVVLLVAGLASLCTFFVDAYWQLAVLRLVAGLASGGVHPLAYSLVGDWFGPSLRACASAFVLGAAGFGTFCGQCLAAMLGSLDWRWVFLILAAPLLFMAHFYHLANGRLGAPLTHQVESGAGSRERQELTLEGLKGMAKSKTNVLMLIQAFPGNVPWGVLVVYLHDFLRTDVGLSDNVAIASIVAVATASFCGMIVGGMVGGHLYAQSGRKLLRFCAAACVLRCVPCVMIFAFPAVVGKGPEGPALLMLIVLLLAAAFGSTLPTANIGAVLLNVNTAEVRGTICAIYSVLDDISKAMGTVVASLLGALVGSRALWLLSAAALLAASVTYAADEARVVEAERRGEGAGFRQLSDEGSHDCMPLLLKQQQLLHNQPGSLRAQPAMYEHQEDIMDVRLRFLKQAEQRGGPFSCEAAPDVWDQLEDHANCSQHRSRL